MNRFYTSFGQNETHIQRNLDTRSQNNEIEVTFLPSQ